MQGELSIHGSNCTGPIEGKRLRRITDPRVQASLENIWRGDQGGFNEFLEHIHDPADRDFRGWQLNEYKKLVDRGEVVPMYFDLAGPLAQLGGLNPLIGSAGSHLCAFWTDPLVSLAVEQVSRVKIEPEKWVPILDFRSRGRGAEVIDDLHLQLTMYAADFPNALSWGVARSVYHSYYPESGMSCKSSVPFTRVYVNGSENRMTREQQNLFLINPQDKRMPPPFFDLHFVY